MSQMVDTAQEYIENNNSWTEWGKLLHESWMLKQSLAEGVSSESVNSLYTAARQAGAWGGKILGAGGRGFLCLLAEPDTHQKIRDALPDLMEVPVAFTNEGSRIIFRTSE